jgi:putative hydrolase of the HAD superfamily
MNRCTIETILFDLDETLYPRRAGIMDQIRTLILAYMQRRLEMSPEEADAVRSRYLHAYGTTMRGLQAHHGIDAEDYLDFVHRLPLEDYIGANPALDEALAAIPQTKVVFTNATREHAERVLDVLGVRHHFEHIVDIRDMSFESKPEPSAYRRICALLEQDPEACMLVEDNVRNLVPAKELGMVTVLVSENDIRPEGAPRGVDYVIPRIEAIGELVGRIAAG